MAGGISAKGSALIQTALAKWETAAQHVQRNAQRGNTGVVTDAVVIETDAAIQAAITALQAIQ